MELQTINEKLKTYFDLKKDIDSLTEIKDAIRKELESHLKTEGIDSLKTGLGTISYVKKEYESLDKNKIKEFLDEEQLKQIITLKESAYIKISEAKKVE